jgi:hypothetical protein
VIDCLRTDCADGAINFCGHWTERGYQPYGESTIYPVHPLEQREAADSEAPASSRRRIVS